ncbi:hypothetical protein TVAG_299410 [Trichomonas vaginalis G3]|uniref:WH2 motif family protein n=1 Tax=Trichomonas vaginalis (strain ATCC PRA-98 / G3) TaxID=412133 RepID=A2EVR8_TRIV3|nr:hypothetical protein TVAGG3_0414210 [Trichomonas vaginalis G3]EAY03278.1 hypothetical protein TVAG_299410 [Trichomonas vaginalis G3]KAI5535567.1 hypothetical protein TVAGG3_0414210 [Trichomonas vaginalis G3]|eukprot:XP_001315501.1 hypothetical protein [Trichomonas vaginalis G3]
MFPAIRLSSFEETTKPSMLDSGDINKCIANLGYFYSIGLFKQMSELQKLSATIFLELEKDFNKLNERMENVSQRINNFKRTAQSVIAQNQAMSPQQFAEKACVQNQMPNVKTATDADLSNADIFVKDLLAKTYPAPTLQPFASIIPNYAELDKQITDPKQFEQQYRQELFEKYKELTQISAKKKRQAVTVPENKDVDKSSTMLHAYTETIVPPPVILLIPPPPGQTSGWRDKALQDMQHASTSSGRGVNTTFVAPPPSMAPSVRPRVPNFNVQSPQLSSFQPPLNSLEPSPSPSFPPLPPPMKPQSFAAIPPPGALPPPPPPPPPPPKAPGGGSLPPPPPAASPGIAAPPPSTPAPTNQGPLPGAPRGHLDLIKAGGFKLKPVKKEDVKPVNEDVDPNSLSIGELLAKVAKVREDTKLSDDDENGDDEEDSEDW